MKNLLGVQQVFHMGSHIMIKREGDEVWVLLNAICIL